jgi:hypothetical protein
MGEALNVLRRTTSRQPKRTPGTGQVRYSPVVPGFPGEDRAMRRIVVCLLIAFASASVVARESKLSDADGGGCPSHSARATAPRAARDAVVAPPPANKTKASSVRGAGGDDAGNRMQSPRWHRFLPGMFR